MTVLIGPECIGSYVHIMEPILRKTAKPTDRPKYEITSLFTHEAVKTPEYKALVDAVTACGIAFFGKAKFEEMVREGVFESPFKKDIGSKGYDTAKFAVRVSSSANESHPPTVLDARHRLPDGKPVPITDKREVYSGARFRVSYACRAYGGPGTTYSPGVKLDLRNVLKVGDGERLAAGGTDGSEFADVAAQPVDPAAAGADMAALLG